MTAALRKQGLRVNHKRVAQAQSLQGLEAAFEQFGGVPAEVLVDNSRTLVAHHDAATREVTFNERFRGDSTAPTTCSSALTMTTSAAAVRARRTSS